MHFLSLLLEERGAGDLSEVAEHCARKLVRRHPHVFGEVEAANAADVLRNWDAIKREEEGRVEGELGDLPGNLPSLIYARKVQRRAAAAGEPQPDIDAALARVSEEARRLADVPGVLPEALRDQRVDGVGELLYAAVAAARELGVDPELALRAAADRRIARAETADSASGPPIEEDHRP